MSPIFTFILVVLGLLAVMGIVVGVANDAINFLNSAIGSKVAPRRVILWIAAVGILVGTLTSSGMMEVARSGVFYPAQFSFTEIMMLFLGMMLGNVLLLDLYNTLGLPTSTTVSMVFGLLGAGVAAALFRIGADPALSLGDLSQFINSGKAMVIIGAILLSVVLAFLAGTLFMYVSRLIFSFRYAPVFKRWGAVWCGISMAGILYFALFKGLKSSGLIPAEISAWVNDHVFLTLLVFWIAAAIILWVMQQLLRINIQRITILAGTFALALAFAGNDLVNFIGVPLAGFDAWRIASEAGSESLMMGGLQEPAKAQFLILLASGLIMVLTLFFSKKSQHVAETELSLASQNEEEERFGSTFLSRGLVRMTLMANNAWSAMIPQRIQQAIDRRFDPLPAEERATAQYDTIRAIVNLTAASVLIAIGTSYQLPLSTTYVVFMVAMGSSLADRSWGRESAVYRITGVMAVISGWFITALGGFVIALATTALLLWGGWIAVVALSLLCAWLLVRSHRREEPKAEEQSRKAIEHAETTDEVLHACIGEVCTTVQEVTRIYNRTLVAVFKENRKVLREMVTTSERLFEEARARKYGIMPTLRRLQRSDIDTGHFYVQVVDYLSEVSKALLHITRPAYEHIDNNHEGLSKAQIVDLMRVNDEVESIFVKINRMLANKEFSELDEILEMRDHLFDTISEAVKNQLRRIDGEEASSTRSSVLYLSILNETKTMVLQARNLLKSQSYFLKSNLKEE